MPRINFNSLRFFFIRLNPSFESIKKTVLPTQILMYIDCNFIGPTIPCSSNSVPSSNSVSVLNNQLFPDTKLNILQKLDLFLLFPDLSLSYNPYSNNSIIRFIQIFK